jgi:hypothetical protein
MAGERHGMCELAFKYPQVAQLQNYTLYVYVDNEMNG